VHGQSQAGNYNRNAHEFNGNVLILLGHKKNILV